jgi:GNAT superfamily N-acetyltransferase
MRYRCAATTSSYWIEYNVMRTFHLESGFGAEIAGLTVSEHSQGQGFGKRLAFQAADRARSRGFGRFGVRGPTERAVAHAFYQGLGFQQKRLQHVFIRPL